MRDPAIGDGWLTPCADGDPALFIVVAVAVLIHQLHIDEHRVDVVWFQPLQYYVYCRNHSPGETINRYHRYYMVSMIKYIQRRVSDQLSATITSDSFFLCSGRARPNSDSGFR